jgi:hypothetical protein
LTASTASSSAALPSNNTDNDATTPFIADGDQENNNTGLSSYDSVCDVPIPMFARQRSTDKTQVETLKARIAVSIDVVVGTEGDSSSPSLTSSKRQVVTYLPFELTKIVKTRIKNGGGVSGGSISSFEYVPFLKYGRSSIRIRYIDEDRGYATVLARADGVQLQPLNSTHYRPILYVDELALQGRHAMELASPHVAQQESKPPVSLPIKLNTLSPIVDTINRQVMSQFEMIEESGLFGDPSSSLGSELDEIRYFLSDERLYRFVISQIITTIHVWLDYAAFRDEVRFYSTKKSMAGISTTTAVTQLLCSIIIFLYLMDGGQTSWIILFSVGSSVAADAWKAYKLFRPELSTKFPFIRSTRLFNETPNERSTAEYDKIAIRYMSYILYPLIGLWAIYSLQYDNYPSLWSWFISNAANGVYTFGFITLCPQLYINYRLKSVAHMPWKVFVYKIFNTFVDDAFAFLIEAPWKHRIMTLRDDVIFLVFLYQAYIYRVDKSRVNEFGYCYDADGDDGDDDNDGDDEGHDDQTDKTMATKLKRE